MLQANYAYDPLTYRETAAWLLVKSSRLRRAGDSIFQALIITTIMIEPISRIRLVQTVRRKPNRADVRQHLSSSPS
jgi:hypothetical protein